MSRHGRPLHRSLGGFFTYSPCGETRMASDTLSCSMLPLLGRMWNWPEVVCSKPL
jgi:hypothetical protein